MRHSLYKRTQSGILRSSRSIRAVAIRHRIYCTSAVGFGAFSALCKWTGFPSTTVNHLPMSELFAFASAALSAASILAMMILMTSRKARNYQTRLLSLEEQYRLVAENCNDVIWTMDLNRYVTYISPAITSVFGYSPEEVLGHRITEFISPEHRQIAIDTVDDLRGLQLPPYTISHTMELEIVKKDGSRVLTETRITFLFDSEGTYAGLIGIASDISNRQKAVELLTAERKQLLSLFDSIGELIYVADPETYRIIYVNQACKEQYGKELVGGLCYQEFQNLDSPCKFCTNHIIFASNGQPYRWECYNQVLDKHYMLVDRTVKWPDGRDLRFELAIDITEPKRAGDIVRRRLSYEKMLSDISLSAVTVSSMDEFLSNALALMGNTLGISRVYIFEHHEDTHTMDNTVEWVGPGVTAEKDNLQDIPESSIPWWVDALRDNGVISYPNIEDIPGEAEKEALRAQDIKSLLVVPIFVGDEYYGFMGFDECQCNREWPDEDVELLKTAARVIGEAIQRTRAEKALRASEANYRAIFDTVNDAIFIHDIETGQMIDGNRQVHEMFGHSAGSPLDLCTVTSGTGIPPYTHETAKGFLQRAAQGEPQLFEWLCKHQNGMLFWVEVSLKLAVLGGAPRILATVTDISERKRAEMSQRTHTSAMNAAGDQIIITNADGYIEFVNPAFERETGYTSNEVMGRHWRMLVAGEKARETLAEAWATVMQGCGWHGEYTSQRKDGQSYIEDMTVTPILDEYGAIDRVISIKRNITEKKLYEKQLDQLAHHDPLTGLPNRLMFREQLTKCIRDAYASDERIAVMFVDLDRFKLVNDTLGHNEGDQLLKQVTDRLTGLSDRVHVVARMGGDEFTLVLSNVRNLESVSEVAQRVLDLLCEPFVLKGHEMFLTASIGISLYPSDGRDVDTLVRNADTAMYRAKEMGKNTYQFYTRALNAEAVERMTLENNLRKAIDRGELLAYYQPRVDIATRRILGVEALIRWHHPTLGMVPPAQFIPLAEETGLIMPITEWILKTACMQNKAWQDAGLPPINVGVNISARQFQVANLVETTRSIIEATGMDPRYLDLELTESAFMINPDHAVHVADELKKVGIKLYLDDFGTGYSSLSQLKHFPIDTVKIDRSFIHNITTDADDAAIAQAIVAMAHSLKLKVVAEGVETIDQLEFLRNLGCDEMQGFLVSRPVPAKRLARLLMANQPMVHDIPKAA